jgi:hypothetical protein
MQRLKKEVSLEDKAVGTERDEAAEFNKIIEYLQW